jgi:ubiquinone/menaquinone biosynthesis C-methylase UbiE
LSFVVGDAEQLLFADASFDLVVNVESSHCYGSVERFLAEVSRVLAPGGVFCFCDLRQEDQLEALRTSIRGCGLELVREEDITPGIVRSLGRNSESRRRWIEHYFPSFLRRSVINFSGVDGGTVYRSFLAGTRTYLTYVLRKA